MRNLRLAFGLLLAACGTPDAAPDAGADAPARPRDAGADVPPSDLPYKGPWVMQPTTTGALVRWESQLRPEAVSVTVTPEAGGAGLSFVGTSTETEVRLDYRAFSPPDLPGTYFLNEVELSGLSPATCYLYELDGYGEGGRFCTMHEPTDHTTPISFYVLGDTSPAFMGTVRLITVNDPRETEFSLHVGDIQYYSTFVETQQLWFELMAPLLEANAFLPCVGNHESEEPFEWEDIYLRLFDHPGGEVDENAGPDGTLYYHFETGGVHFFSLSTEHPLELGSVQHDWLLAQLEAAEAEPGYRFSILYLHRPIYSYGDYGPRADQVMAIEPVVRDHRIPLVMAGHMHGYERFEIDYPGAPGLGHATYVTTGAGGFSGTMASVNEGLPADPDLAALRVASGAFFQAMQFEITSSAAGDVLSGLALDDLGTVRDSFDVVLPPR